MTRSSKHRVPHSARPTRQEPRPLAPPLPPPSPAVVVWPLAVLLVFVGTAVYANSFTGVFVFDDVHAILGNGRIRRLWPIGPILACERPLVELSLAVNYALGGLQTAGYHAVNLAVHLIAGLALFGLVRRSLALFEVPQAGTDRTTISNTPRAAFWTPEVGFAFAVALLWTVHPLQTESVTYIVQRGESMMGMFCLLSAYALVRSAEPRAAARWKWLCVMFCASAMACKAVAVVLPIVLFFFDWRCLSGSLRKLWTDRFWLHFGLVLTWAVLAATGVVGQILAPSTDRIAIGLGFKGVSPWVYLLTQSEVIIRYLRLSLIPYPLCLDYAWPAARGIGDVWLQASTIVALLVCTVWGMIRLPRLGIAGAWFFLFLAPTSSVIPVRDLAVEHRMYLPLVAVIVVAVAAVRALLHRGLRLPRPRFAVASVLLVVALLGLSTITSARNQDYQDDLEMWRDVAGKQPRNARAHVNVGALLERRGDLDGAVEAYQRALTIDNEYADAHYNLSVALLRLGRTEEAEKHLREALRIAPEDPGANVALGDACTDRRDFEGALAAYSAATKTLPNDATLRVKLCSSLRRLQRIPEAFEACQEAIRLGPSIASAYEAMGLVHVVRGDMAAAIPLFERTLELDPRNHAALGNLATCLKSEGRVVESIEPYRRAIALRPEEPMLHVQLADSMMTLERQEDAITEFEAALRLAPQDLDAHLYYARALHSMGKDAEAVVQYQHVLSIRPDHPEAVRAIQQIVGGP